MNLEQAEKEIEELSDSLDHLMDKLVEERELADSAMADAEHALEYLERFRGRSNAVSIALTSLRSCVSNLQARIKERPGRGVRPAK